MCSKSAIVLLLVAIQSSFICGQYFRKGYVYNEELKSFYKVNKVAKTWLQANISCAREGAYLFFPENETEALTVIDLWNAVMLDANELYIGENNWNDQDTYETVDGRLVSEVYNNWMDGEPNSTGNNSCVVMDNSGNLKAESCDTVFPFICKKALDSFQWNADCNLPDLDYKYNEEMDRCYKFHLDPQNWTDSYLICDAEESYLAILNSVEEDQILINITAAADKDSVEGDYLSGALHLGFQNNSGFWETIKGVPLEKSGFGGGWADSQPDGEGTETCGSMFFTGELNDIGCWQRMFFICEHEIDRSISNNTIVNDTTTTTEMS